MYVLLTGIPGTGKSTIANEFKKFRKDFVVVSDKDFCVTQNLGQPDKTTQEYIVSITNLSKAFLEYVSIHKRKNVVFEGHLWAELPKSLLKKIDFVFILVTSKSVIRKRLKERAYSELKIFENLFCQDTHYLENLLLKKNIYFYKININDNLKSNLSKINKHLNF